MYSPLSPLQEDKASDLHSDDGLGDGFAGNGQASGVVAGASKNGNTKKGKKNKKKNKRKSKILRERADTVLGRMDATLNSMTDDMRRIVAASSDRTLDLMAERLSASLSARDIGKNAGGNTARGGMNLLNLNDDDATESTHECSSDVMIRSPTDLVDIINDMKNLRKNVLLARHFHRLNKDLVITFHKNAKVRE